MTIICATHFTESSLAAVRVATALVRKRPQPLHLVNVQASYELSAHKRDLHRAQAVAALSKVAAQLQATGVDVNTALLSGALGPAVRQFCSERAAALLVVGDTDRASAALGQTVLEQLTNDAGVPTLVVRHDRPLLAWVQGTAPLRVMLALDRSSTSARALEWVSELAAYGPLVLVVQHVWWPAAEHQRRGTPEPRIDDGHQAMEQLVRGELEASLRRLPPNVRHQVHLEIGQRHIAERLLAAAAQDQVDLLLVGTHPHQGSLARFQSVSRAVLGLAPMSVACVPSLPVVQPTVPPRPSLARASGPQLAH